MKVVLTNRLFKEFQKKSNLCLIRPIHLLQVFSLESKSQKGEVGNRTFELAR